MDIIKLLETDPGNEQIKSAKRLYYWLAKGFYLKDACKMENITLPEAKHILSQIEAPRVRIVPYSDNKKQLVKWISANYKVYHKKTDYKIRMLEINLRKNSRISNLLNIKLMNWKR